MSQTKLEIHLELSEQFKQVDEIVRRILEEEIYRAALQTQNKARQIAPIDTGNLRRSIQATGWEDVEKDLIYHVQAKAEYAGYVEYGTKKMSARPFLEPSANEALEDFIRRVKQRTDSGGG